MQYLSKAYNYYSGINPATLSGAIDVIVVRHIDEDGVETLSSSPFHIRFGKLQVLRAGEKRVIMRMPNNLPPPHIAPFSMKVGETGEAFFVLETDEDVPEELLTSPVVMPTDNPGSEDQQVNEAEPMVEETSGPSLTQQPFGATEAQVRHSTSEDRPPRASLDRKLAEVDFLDLNDQVRDEGDRHDTKDSGGGSGILHAASSLLPSLPFLSNASSDNVTPSSDRPNTESSQPPNPIAARAGESTELPDHDDKLSDVAEAKGAGDDALPKVRQGEGDGPEVVYGKDVVLDMAGYHSTETVSLSTESSAPKARPDDGTQKAINTLVDQFAVDLLASTSRPAFLPNRLTETNVTRIPTSNALKADLPQETPVTPSSRRRFERGLSEPPPDQESPQTSPTSRRFTPLKRIPQGTVFPTLQAKSTNVSYPASEGPPDDDDIDRDLEQDIDRLVIGEGEDRIRADSLPPSGLDVPRSLLPGKLKNVEENPYLFVLEADGGRSHTFELALCGSTTFAPHAEPSDAEENAFYNNRVTFQSFIEDPQLVDDSRLVIRYSLLYLTWTNAHRLLYALSVYRRSLAPPGQYPSATIPISDLQSRPVSGAGWSRWWRRTQAATSPDTPVPVVKPSSPPPAPPPADIPAPEKQYAKTLRLSSEQLKQLNLKSGPNTVSFSVTSSYSGLATCTARIFLWEATDQIVISDIDGTITKSDALGHVFAAIGRDWTHLGIAKLYTDVGNNGYKMMYLTSRAIGQADSTREYLKSIIQGDYRLPEGPVIMSPDRLMASLHREVIMRKPELFKMACLRDIQRLFGEQAKGAFYAGFGNRITDAMSYRSVGIETSKIYTIDSTGVVKTELLVGAGHKGSYLALNDLVNEVFPPVSKKVKPEFTDFSYWRSTIPDIPLPDFSPPSPTLSARSDTSKVSSGMLSKIASIGRRSSRQPLLPTTSRPSSPLVGPASTSDELSEAEEDDPGRRSRESSMPGSYEDRAGYFPDEFIARGERADFATRREREAEEGRKEEREDDSFDDDAIFDDDILATGEMKNVPF